MVSYIYENQFKMCATTAYFKCVPLNGPPILSFKALKATEIREHKKEAGERNFCTPSKYIDAENKIIL